jgi:enoyl-CoA hydratase/carnithine racemase
MATPQNFVQRDQVDGVITLTLSHPETLNCFSSENQFLELTEKICKVNADPDARVLIITGQGRAFCAGGDLHQMARREGFSAGDVEAVQARYRRSVHQLPAVLSEVDIPTIAAVNGAAYGAGCDLACFCDIRIAGDSARFSVSFARLGIVAGDGGAWILPRLVGRSKAMELALTADPVDAHEARRIGLVSEVVADDMLQAEVQNLARRIACHPRQAMRMNKRLLRKAEQLSLANHLDLVAAFQAIAHATDEHMTAVRATLDTISQRNTNI